MRADQLTAGVEKRLNEQKPALTVVKKSLVEHIANVEPEEVDFLWAGRIPRGKLTMLDGDPGAGKSYVSLALAAVVSKGAALPYDQEPEAPLRSLIIAAEDGAGDTIRPRLEKLGADMDMIAIPNRSMNFTPSSINASLIDRMLGDFAAALVVIDPIIALAHGRNTDRASDVREMLGPLAHIAEQKKAAIVLIRHLNKNTQGRALYRGQGSIDFTAICRSAFICVQDQADPERRLLCHTKASLAGIQPTLEYFIDKDGGFRWGDQTTESADDALGTGEPRKDREAQQLGAAKRFLEDVLGNNPMPSGKLKAKATEAGISTRTLWRAKELMDIKASKERGTGEWWWRLA